MDPGDTQDRRKIRDVCRITHRNDEAYIGALAVVLAIRSVITGNWSQQRSFLAAAVSGWPDSAVQDSIEQCASEDVPLSEVGHHFGATGHVVDMSLSLSIVSSRSRSIGWR